MTSALVMRVRQPTRSIGRQIMANTADEDSARKSASGFELAKNPVLPRVIAGLAVLLLVGTILASVVKPKETPPEDEGVRALVVAAGDVAHTVVVPPCRTGVRITARNAAEQIETPGATVVRLPGDTRSRVLLIPRCSASTSKAGAESIALVPSSLFVLTPGAKTAVGTLGSDEKKPIEPRSTVLAPSASQSQTIVIPQCTGTARGKRPAVLTPAAESPTTLIAPRC